MRHPTGWSRWTHHEKGGEYIFLTEAVGLDEEDAEEFAYFLWIDPATGVHKARVCRMSTWHAIMQPHPTAESYQDQWLRESQAEADEDPELDELI